MHGIETYGLSLQGLAHATEGRPCQDAHLCRLAAGGRAVVGIADGVGSAAKSELGSQEAVERAVGFIADHLPPDADARVCCSLMLAAMVVANDGVHELARAAGDEPELYHTTLTLALFDDQCCYVGHSGDGGALGITAAGDVVELTVEQRGEDGVSVIPLAAGPGSWQVARYSGPLQAVVLATDGLLAQLKPYLLRDAGRSSVVYEPLALYLADPAGGCDEARRAADDLLAQEDASREGVARRLARIAQSHGLESGDALGEVAETVISLAERILDDVTVAVAMIADGEPQAAREDLLNEPDWAALQEEFDRRFYGGAA